MFRVNLESGVIDARGVVEERHEGQTGFSSDDFVEAFADLEGRDITIVINSAGGVVSEGLSIYNQIEARSGETTIVVDAVAASIASVITMAADRIVMRRKAQLFIHDPWTVAMGNATGFRTVADHLDALGREIAIVYQERASLNGVSLDVDTWLQYMRDETWFNASEAIELGLADEISRPQVRESVNEDEDEDERSPYAVNASESDAIRAEIDLTVSDGMVEEARKALAWREEYNRGGTQVGVTRANQIINDGRLSEDTWRRVYSYLSRHEVDKQGEGFTPDEDGFPSAGRIAWGLWGGDPAFTRSRKIVEQLQREEEEQDLLEPVAVLHSAKVLAEVLDKRHRIMRQRLGIS